MRGFSDLIEKDALKILPIEACIERRNSFGGTSPQSVEIQLIEALGPLMERKDRVRQEMSLIDRCWDELSGS
jgi:argininosuccinate lyase